MKCRIITAVAMVFLGKEFTAVKNGTSVGFEIGLYSGYVTYAFKT